MPLIGVAEVLLITGRTVPRGKDRLRRSAQVEAGRAVDRHSVRYNLVRLRLVPLRLEGVGIGRVRIKK